MCVKVILGILIFISILSIEGCKGHNNPSNFEFNAGESGIVLSRNDTIDLIEYYRPFKQDRVDTLEWPLVNSDVTLYIIVDVSGTMFSQQSTIFRNGAEISFFDFSTEKLMKYLKDNNYYGNVTKVVVKIFGSNPVGEKYSIDGYKDFVIPKKRLAVEEFYYSNNNGKIQIDVLSVIQVQKYNISDSIIQAIEELASPYKVGKRIILNQTPLLEQITWDCEEAKLIKGKKYLFYLTDGYFRIDNTSEFTPYSEFNESHLKEKFKKLRAEVTLDTTISYIFFGMNTKGNMQFKQKMNGFYKWFLVDSFNNIKIFNVK